METFLKLSLLALLFSGLVACGSGHKSGQSALKQAPVAVSAVTYTCAYGETFTSSQHNAWTGQTVVSVQDIYNCISDLGEVCVAQTDQSGALQSSSCKHDSISDVVFEQ